MRKYSRKTQNSFKILTNQLDIKQLFRGIIILLFASGVCRSQIPAPDVTKRSVVHIETDDGTCNGILLNNTNDDARALILTAGHCISDDNRFLSVVVGRDLVVEESNLKSVAWRSSELITLQSSRDLDYRLLELSEPIPEYILPYYAGWDVRTILPISSYGIHSPEVEKIFIEDLNKPKRATFRGITEFGGTPVNNGTLNIVRWEIGFTAAGSSGSPLFNQSSRVMGILSGGASSEANPTNDFYGRFDLIFEAGVKEWLDPISQTELFLDGKDFLKEENNIFKKTNYKNSDKLSESTDIELVSESFRNQNTKKIKGVYLTLNEVNPTDLITISVISDGILVHEQVVFSGLLDEFSENYIPFDEIAEVNGNYAIQIKHNQSLEFPTVISKNSTIILGSREINERSLLIGTLNEGKLEMQPSQEIEFGMVYPNPSTQNFYLDQNGLEKISNIKIYTSEGEHIVPNIVEDYLNRLLIDMTGYQKGLYFLQYQLGERVSIEKILLI